MSENLKTNPSPLPDTKAFHQFERVVAEAEANGLSADAAEALLGIDASVFHWRRRMRKGEMIRNILAELSLDIEQAEFEALTAVTRLTYGTGCMRKTEVTIGDIAEELTIDPSRASRLVTALVNKGYLRRAASQDDARKTILVPTPATHALFDAFMTLKWRLIFDAFRNWNQADIADFERLFARYVDAMAEAIDKTGKGSPEAETYAAGIRSAIAAELESR